MVVGGSVGAGAVALRKESVDRNRVCAQDITDKKQSLSARRAWIEMLKPSPTNVHTCVALRKESVDRNVRACIYSEQVSWSLSARRAWIEMMLPRCRSRLPLVALRKESVDRNLRWRGYCS